MWPKEAAHLWINTLENFGEGALPQRLVGEVEVRATLQAALLLKRHFSVQFFLKEKDGDTDMLVTVSIHLFAPFHNKLFN